MGVLIVLGAALVALYGATTGSGLALSDAANDEKDLLLMAVQSRIDDLDAIRLDHPGGVLVEHLDQRGAVAYTTYLVGTSSVGG